MLNRLKDTKQIMLVFKMPKNLKVIQRLLKLKFLNEEPDIFTHDKLKRNEIAHFISFSLLHASFTRTLPYPFGMFRTVNRAI